MSLPIRPLPLEAASQRTETDAAPNSSLENPAGFEALLDLHAETPPPEPGQEAEVESSANEKVELQDPWTILGCIPPLNLVQVQTLPVPLPFTPAPALELQEQAPPSGLIEENRPTIESPPPNGAVPPPLFVNIRQPLPELKQEFPAVPTPEVEETAAPGPQTDQKDAGIPAAKQLPMLVVTEKSADLRSPELEGSFLVKIEPEGARPVRFIRPQAVEIAAPQPAVVFEPKIQLTTVPETPPVREVRATALLPAIEQQIQVLRGSLSGELKVVLRPDAHTELYLHIRHEGGQVQLQARCERGDFNWLDSQWGTIQSSLGAQGVRVEPLEAASRPPEQTGSATTNDSGTSRRGREGQRRDPFEEQDLPFSTNNRKQSPAASRGRGWQSWA